MNSLGKKKKKELKEVFRDKKSLSMMLIIPIFIPLNAPNNKNYCRFNLFTIQ